VNVCCLDVYVLKCLDVVIMPVGTSSSMSVVIMPVVIVPVVMAMMIVAVVIVMVVGIFSLI
jgi:hypothetical protein